MDNGLELKLLKEIAALKQEINAIKGETKQPAKPNYQYSKIRESDLEQLFEIERQLDKSIFDVWFQQTFDIDAEIELLLLELIAENKDLIDSYSEEDLKVNFIIPILNKIHFKSVNDNVRGFY